LDEILKSKPEKKESIVKHLFQTLSKTLDKGTLNHTIVHKGLLEFFTHASNDQIQDMIELLKELAVEILHTKEGSLVAMKCFLYATPKDRKAIMKSFKPFVMKIAKEEYGHLVLVQILDAVDDTVLASKSLLSDFVKNISEIISDKYARRVLLYILAGRNPSFLPKDLITLLNENDELKSANSKKDPLTRQKELLKYISNDLIKYIAENASTLLKEPFSSQMINAAMLSAIENKKAATDALLELAKEDPQSLENEHVMNHILSNRVYKAMVANNISPVEGNNLI
jgi:pumilio family protein 6